MKSSRVVLAALPLIALAYASDKPYVEGYGDAVYSKLTGFSTFQQVRYGIRKGPHDLHAIVKNEYFDTSGSDLAFTYSLRGTSVGIGYRYWLPGNKVFLTVQQSRIVAGESRDQNDFRAGIAGYYDWRKGSTLTDVYGEAFYVQRAEDTFGTIRVRPGYVIREDQKGRLWAYSVVQGWASGKGENGTENRIEAGLGVGYVYMGHYTLNFELRSGYVYRGQITNRNYFNPTVILAGSF